MVRTWDFQLDEYFSVSRTLTVGLSLFCSTFYCNLILLSFSMKIPGPLSWRKYPQLPQRRTVFYELLFLTLQEWARRSSREAMPVSCGPNQIFSEFSTSPCRALSTFCARKSGSPIDADRHSTCHRDRRVLPRRSQAAHWQRTSSSPHRTFVTSSKHSPSSQRQWAHRCSTIYSI